MSKKFNAESLLDILGNKTRREIIFLLAERPRFVSELSEIIGVKRKAIIEHLSLLEKEGIVRSVFKRLEKGRPRKYYEISREFFVKIVLTRSSLVIDCLDNKDASCAVNEIENEVEKLENEKEKDRLLASYLADKIERRIREIEGEWMKLHKLLSRIKKLLLV